MCCENLEVAPGLKFVFLFDFLPGVVHLHTDVAQIVTVIVDKDYHRIATLSLKFLIWNIHPQPVDWDAPGDDFSGVDVMIQSNTVTLTKTKFQGGLFLTLQARR